MKKYSKILSFLLTVALLFSVLSVIAFAENGYKEWTLSDDERVLSDGTRTFKRYDNAPPDLYASSTQIYEYMNTVLTSEGYYAHISSASAHSEIIWLYKNGYNVFYATEGGTAELDKFLSTDPSSYRITEPYNDTMSAAISSETVAALDGTKETLDVNVRSLASATQYKICAQNSDATLSYIHGTLFFIDGEYYYAEHSQLSNDRFDADGNISLRNGTLSLLKLDAALSNEVADIADTLKYTPITYIVEGENEVLAADSSDLLIFWIIYILLGFAAPIPLICLGLMLPHSQKLGYPKYWYKAAVVGAVWITLAIILAVVLMI